MKERQETNTMTNPQSFRISRTAKLTLATATTLLLAVLALLLLAAPPRPAEALIPGGGSLAPTLRVDKSSVAVSEEETVTNTGGYDDLMDTDADTVRVSASLGTLTQSGTMTGAWNWSYKAPSVTATETKTVTITATDSTGRYTTKSFSLTVNNLPPPVNDMFSGALELKYPAATTISSSTTTGYTTSATMETGEPRPSSPTKDCGIYGVSNSVWFKFTYGGQGGLPLLPYPNASYNFDTQGSNFDTVLALYEGSSLGTLRQIECSNDNSLPNWNDNLSIPQSKLSVGKTYYVQLTGTGGARSGKYQLHYEPREPTVGSNTSAITASGKCSDVPDNWYFGPMELQFGLTDDGAGGAGYGPIVLSSLGYCTASGATLPAAGEVYYAVLDILVTNTYADLDVPTLTAIRLPEGTQFATDVGKIECRQRLTANDPWVNVTADPDARCIKNPTQITSDGTSAGAARAGAWDLGARPMAPRSLFRIILPLRSSNPQDSVLVGHVEAPADPAAAHPRVKLPAAGSSQTCHEWSCLSPEQQRAIICYNGGVVGTLCR
jgi:hypothetical protein